MVGIKWIGFDYGPFGKDRKLAYTLAYFENYFCHPKSYLHALQNDQNTLYDISHGCSKKRAKIEQFSPHVCGIRHGTVGCK
jgi:hypothetical protein